MHNNGLVGCLMYRGEGSSKKSRESVGIPTHFHNWMWTSQKVLYINSKVTYKKAKRRRFWSSSLPFWVAVPHNEGYDSWPVCNCISLHQTSLVSFDRWSICKVLFLKELKWVPFYVSVGAYLVMEIVLQRRKISHDKWHVSCDIFLLTPLIAKLYY